MDDRKTMTDTGSVSRKPPKRVPSGPHCTGCRYIRTGNRFATCKWFGVALAYRDGLLKTAACKEVEHGED